MKFNNAKILKDAQKQVVALVKDSVNIMGTEAVKFYTLNFRKQGFDDNGIDKWQPRKNEFFSGIARVRKRERLASGRAILVKSGALRRSLRYYRNGLTSVMITSNLPYADAHNTGVKGRLPKRQFIGNSANLDKIILRKFDKRIYNIFK